MNIENIIVHEIQKEDEQSVATLDLRTNENTIDEHALTLSSQLTALFKKTGLNTGQFSQPENEDDPLPHFVTLLNTYYIADAFSDFVAFTQAASREFKRQLDDASSSKGGYLWFNHYTHNEEHFLSVVMLRKKAGLSLKSDLTLDEIEQLDLDKLHMAARINLSAWLNDSSQRYISFRIGKNAKDVTDYFAKFIGCVEYTKAKLDTQNLIAVTSKFCDTHELTAIQTENVKQLVLDTCISWLDNSQPAQLDRLSSILDNSLTLSEDDSGKFLEIAQNEPYCLTNEIPVERAALRGLTRYVGRNRKLSISFDSDLLNVSVFFDAGEKEILITDVPDSLIKQLSPSE
ncbi:nucleoid-associated protein [Vibrio splendidus]|uniref:nucleoid-associated protein n=1 Tax=Vibrio splendidus TaxID=29497 RepID=UPI001E373E16|nr:nucleoid-associated protein [Vibrio splendidus]